ncbi:MAG: beta strand repeat-containing protein [Caulobacteraceae bacterium]
MAQIHWASAVSADFSAAADWTGGVVPGVADDAILDASGGAYTVTVSASEGVNSLQTAANATLSITSVALTANAGTGSGVNAGVILVGDGTTLRVGGTVDNSGQISLLSVGGATNLSIISGSNLTLTGHGKVRLSDNGANLIDAETAGTTLTNVDNKIVGVGQLGSSNLTIVNDSVGILKANGSLQLVLTAQSISNAGAIRAGPNSTLIIENTTVNNSSTGVLKARIGAHINLQSAHIVGGTLITTDSGIIQTTDGGSILDGSGSAVNNAGAFEINDNTALTVLGTINNTGTITLGANLGGVTLTLANNTTLTGGGHLTLTDSNGNAVSGASGLTLTNANNTISGSGNVGGGSLVLVNQAGGIIDANGASNRLLLDTGTNSITNAGLIEATGAGGGKIKSAITNNGVLEADGGTLSVKAAVSGSGSAVIASGMLVFQSSFTQNVAFTGTTGTLGLVAATSYTGAVSGFSHSGGTGLDLRDVGFVSSNEATFAGNSSGGILTVTDGTNTAHINLAGDYTAATFTASSDGAGGVTIVDPTSGSGAGATSGFVQAMAGLGARGSGSLLSKAHASQMLQPMLLAARAHFA